MVEITLRTESGYEFKFVVNNLLVTIPSSSDWDKMSLVYINSPKLTVPHFPHQIF